MPELMERQIECFAGNIVEVPDLLRLVDADDFSERERSDPSSPCFRIMTPKDGDKRVTWVRTIMAEVKAAKKMFMDLLKSGMIAFKVDPNTGKQTSQRMDVFDPTAEEVIFVPVAAISGG